MNYRTQYERQELIKERCGITTVTCGNCGGFILAKDDDFIDRENMVYAGHHCPHCGMKGDCCDFPDAYSEVRRSE